MMKRKADAVIIGGGASGLAAAIELGMEGPYTSFWHMFGWNVFGILAFGPMVATARFFGTLNRVEKHLNSQI